MAKKDIPEEGHDDYKPLSVDNEEEHPPTGSRRATRSTATYPPTVPQEGDNAETQGENSDDASDVSSEDNASEASDQDAAEDPQVTHSGRTRKCGPTIYCGVFSKRKMEPTPVVRDKGDFFCIICGSNFTRAAGVNYHFAGCVKKHGNPDRHSWNDHTSCTPKTTSKYRLVVNPSPHGESSASKKPVTKKQSSAPSSSNQSGGDETVRTRPASQSSALPTGSRATRSRQQHNATASTPPTEYPGDFPSGPSAARAQPLAQPATLPTGPRVTRSQATQRTATRTGPSSPPESHSASKRSTAQRKSKQAESTDAKPAKTRSTKTKQHPSTETDAGTGYRCHIDESAPPLSDLTAMFDDLVSRALTETSLPEAMKVLPQKRINVATMCSGTESPLLSLKMIQNSFRLYGLPELNIVHQFSAEIVPSKQAYIERNFHPKKLFRDIREIAQGGPATTAYGAVTDVPPEVDWLVAGFSCVDFSRLNKKKKKLTELGESGDTFQAILEYAKVYRPYLVLLENVEGAPWDLLKAIWQNDREATQAQLDKLNRDKEEVSTDFKLDAIWKKSDPGYSAQHVKVDAKNYYIPHTRTRKYMICVDRRRFSSPKLADAAVEKWAKYLKALERKASVSVEAFLLSEDDPRLQSAKALIAKTGKPKQERDWAVCNGRYETYRRNQQLGILRPILDWTNDGAIKASSYLWTDWTSSQVERIHDTIEVSYLRNAAQKFDAFYKTRFWELSQNVDRFQDNTPAGVINCIVPHGMPFSSTRGGPIIGLEAIALQGLPIDTLSLTRESERELYDLAGNAMTSTVVGAALISAMAVFYTILDDANESVSQPPHDSGSNSKPIRHTELDEEQVLRFDGSAQLSIKELCQKAKASIRLCHCEGQSLTASTLIRMCKCCGHFCCEKCGNKPKHDYELLGGTGVPLRIDPQEFRKQVRYALPTRLEIDGISPDRLEEFAQRLPKQSEQDWKIFSEAILLAFKQEFRFESSKRSHCWKVSYNATHSRLELVFDQEKIYWLLYGKPGLSEPGNSPVRKLFRLPLARLTVRGTTMGGEVMTAESMLQGSWEIRLPMTHNFAITVTPQGQLVDSWEKKLGLQGNNFIDKRVYTSLRVAYTSDSGAGQVLGHDICGEYDLLENCGTASSSLHKKRPTANARDAPELYLFLDADRMGPPDHDCYVFSTEIQRLEYGETRYIAVQVNRTWRPPYEGSNPPPESPLSVQAECAVNGQWAPCTLSMRPYKGMEHANSRFPKAVMTMPVFGTEWDRSQYSTGDLYGCLHENSTTALLSCSIPGQITDSVGWEVGRWRVIDSKSERQVAFAFAWLFARVQDLGGFNEGWRSLDDRPSGYQECSVCAPRPPKIMWTCSRVKAKKPKIVPYEDGREAGDFERNIKARPAPFLVQTYIDDDEKRTGRLSVGLHLPTLVHRALARIGNITDSDVLDITWRLDTHYEAPTRYKLRDFTLTNNKLVLEADYAFPTGENLRPEQKRSLRWMIGQEADDVSFYEEEVEESTLSQLSWRAEVRARRNRLVRGGILADEVGYGKTATTLALIDAQQKKAEEYAEKETLGCISLKATLILVPPHLVRQWTGQARKFLGLTVNDDEILVLKGVTDLAKTSVQRIKKALIIIASWQVISSPAYLTRMSHFAALPQGPSSGEREIDAWLTRACENIEKHMGELDSESQKPNDFAATLKLRLEAAHTDKEILRDVPTQRLKGAKYEKWNAAECVKVPELKPAELTKAVKHMTKCSELDSMTGILLHMFDFYRIVVDEYTYVDEKQKVEKLSRFITTVHARSRWVLSGTPNIHDFGEVRSLASFLSYNLGVVDDAAGVLKGTTIKRIREDRTAAEQFRAFGYSHTAAWHINRQAHAQKFLDKYASKNVAEIGEIKSFFHLRPHLLGAAETILNAELQQQLQATDMKIIMRGKQTTDNHRFQRYKDLLQGCKKASECLLRSCSYFEFEEPRSAKNELLEDEVEVEDNDVHENENNSSEDSTDVDSDDEGEPWDAAEDVDNDDESEASDAAMDIDDDDEGEPSDTAEDVDIDDESEASDAAMEIDDDHEDIRSLDEEEKSPEQLVSEECEKLITIREEQLNALTVELDVNLIHAEWLLKQCARAPKPEHQGTHYTQWKSEIEKAGHQDPIATSNLRHYLSTAPAKVDCETEELYYRDKPTAAESKEEMSRASERGKREKGERIAAKKAGKGTQSREVKKAKKDEVDEGEEIGINDNEATHAEDQDSDLPDLKPIKIDKDNFENFANVLRRLTGHLRSLARELTSRTRSLRFARGAQELYKCYTNLGHPPTCQSCGTVVLDQDSISINIRCGHLTCEGCIQTTNPTCAVDGCAQGSESYCLRTVVDLVGDGRTWPYGSKLGNIVALINSLPKDEQILLFVQYEDVMHKMAAVLEAASISNYALSKSAGRQLVTMMNDFQENDTVTKKRVLILNPSDETAAGINLTNANHVIFASPLLTDTQQAYDASMTQCIGRAKRYGQQKTVHVYRFAALNTIDVDILQERDQKTLVKKQLRRKRKAAEMSGDGGVDPDGVELDGDWLLVGEDEIDYTMEAGWGSGYGFKSNPNEED